MILGGIEVSEIWKQALMVMSCIHFPVLCAVLHMFSLVSQSFFVESFTSLTFKVLENSYKCIIVARIRAISMFSVAVHSILFITVTLFGPILF